MKGWEAVRFGWLLACALAASVTDVRERRIPNPIVAVCALATPAWVAAGVLSWSDAVLGGALLGGLLLVPALLGTAGMGDAKLAAALGLGIGARAAGPLLVGTAAAMLIVVGGATLVARRMSHIWPATWPLAPFLVVGVAVAALVVR